MRNAVQYIVLTVFIVFFLSCALNNKEEQADPGNTGGMIRINVPLISQRAQAFIEEAGRAMPRADRAIIIANRVEFTVKDSGLNTVKEWTYYPLNEAAFDGTETNGIVAAGSGYTLEAKVYNTVVSTDTPVVTGVSPAFDVTAGSTTPVTVTCVPYNPSIANENTTYQFTATPTFYFDNTFQSTGGEGWYTITTTTPLTVIEVIPDADNHVVAFLYDMQGIFRGYAADSGFNTHEPGSLEWLVPLPTGQSYYIGVMPITFDGNATCTLDISYYPGPDDSDEENDTIETARELAPSTPLDAFNIDYDYFRFTVDDQVSLDIAIEITILNEPEYNLWFYFYDSTRNPVDIDYIEAPAAGLLYETTVTSGGEYYFQLLPATIPVGAEYSVEWRYQ